MAVTVEDLNEHLGYPEENAKKLDRYMSAAISKARAAGVPQYKNNAQYDLFILNLAAMYYDNRGMAFSGSYQATAEDNARKMINSYVLELRWAGEDCAEDGGTAT